MNEIEYRRAKTADAKMLADCRIAFLEELCGEQDDETTILLRKNLESYFAAAIEDGSFVGLIARSGDDVVGTGGMVFRVQPGSFKNPSGRTAYLLNMYTIPAFRRRGICKRLLLELMDIARGMGVVSFELHATKDGEPVYQKHGFEEHHEPTYRKHEAGSFVVPPE